MPLYGNELDRDTNPYEAGLGRVVKLDKPGDFVGRAALERVAEAGPDKQLVGLTVRGRGIARHGYPVHLPGEREEAGVVTSGAPSPTLGVPIAMAYLPPASRAVGTMVEVAIRGVAGRGRDRPATLLQARRRRPSAQGGDQRGGARRSSLHARPRMAARRRRRGDRRHHRVRRDELGDVVFVELPAAGTGLEPAQSFGVIESVKTASDLYAPAAGEVVETNGQLTDQPELVNDDPYGEGWMIRIRLADPEAASRPSERLMDAEAYRQLIERPDRPTYRSTSPMTYGPHTDRPPADARRAGHRFGRRALRRHPGRDARRRPGPAAARGRADARPAARGAGRTQPRRPGDLPRRRRVPPPHPADRRPDPVARRVLYLLYAVPARDQPGHAADDLRVPVADRRADRAGRRVRLALRRWRRDRRGGADDRARHAPRSRAGQPRRAPPLRRHDADLLRGRPAVARRAAHARRRHDRPRGARARAGRRRAARRGRDHRPAQRVRHPRADGRGGSPRPRRRRAVRGRRRAGLARRRWRRPPSTTRTSRSARASRSASRSSTAARTWACSPRAPTSSGRCPAGWSAAPRTSKAGART